MCERFAGQEANITTVPVSVLRVTRQLTRLFEWTNDVADRLAFSEVIWTVIYIKQVILIFYHICLMLAMINCVQIGFFMSAAVIHYFL